MASRALRPVQLALFSLLPAAALLLAAEAAVRLAGLDRPAFYAGGHGGVDQAGSIERGDVDLGWSMKPGYVKSATFGQPAIVTNSLGLRSPEVAAKRPGELRILALGESTTLGTGVRAEETYALRLQELLAQSLRPRPVTVINAGVSAYSSFQSLKYLELRGLALQPDVVLFYHELNDYLPSTFRDPRLSEVEILRTDRQIYDSGLVRLSRWFLAHSALYRAASYAYARHGIERLLREAGDPVREPRLPVEEIGLPAGVFDASFPYRLTAGGDRQKLTGMHPAAVGRRVTDEERLHNLRRLTELCRENGAVLVVMHPSYQASRRHECLLTRFCAEHRVLMFETHDILHPVSSPGQGLFSDFMHPTAAGHEGLAEGLFRFIRDNVLRDARS